MKELYVVNCCRTAIGSFGGSLKNTPAVDMGAIVVKEALKRANVAPENVDELMFGCILTAGQGQNPARQVSVKAGIPYSVPAYTVGMVCGSGMKSVIEAGRAILAGDALQSDAFLCMTSCPLPADRVLRAVHEFAAAAGSFGMAGGQELDMIATGRRISLEDLRHLHALKTGAILRASVTCGAILAGADSASLEKLGVFGAELGVAFQIADDILDVVSDTATLGKPAGSDEEEDKNTYPALVGLDRSRALARQHADSAIAAIRDLSGGDADFLRGLAVFTVERVK